MFEDKVSKATNILKGVDTYFILTHKKHNREMYIRVNDKAALNFIKPKFDSGKKRFIHFLLRLGILQPFLKKIKLRGNMSAIFVGGQIKGFDLYNEIVYSFPHTQWDDEKFVDDKCDQRLLGQYGFAPEIISFDKERPYSTEELCTPYTGDIDAAFDRLVEFHNKFPGFIHGEFAREQVVEKDGRIMFVDWNLREGDPLEDLDSMYRFGSKEDNVEEYDRLKLKLN